MACSKPETKIKVKSEVHVSGKVEIDWEIVGSSGPLSHLLRSRACCFVNVPVCINPASDIKLRFHLKPCGWDEELIERYCSQGNNYTDSSSQFLAQTDNQSREYSLLVDVLSPQEDVLINVSVMKHNRHQQTPLANNFVSIDAFSARENLVVVPRFWTVDKGGNIDNIASTFGDTVEKASFHLTVTAYDMVSESTKTDVTNGTENKVNEQDVSPKAKTRVLKNVIRKSKEIVLSGNFNLLKAVIFGIIIVTSFVGTWNAVKFDKNHENLDNEIAFWTQMEPELIEICNLNSTDDFQTVAEKYNLTRLENFIERIRSLNQSRGVVLEKTATTADISSDLPAPQVLAEPLNLENSPSPIFHMSTESPADIADNIISDSSSAAFKEQAENSQGQVTKKLRNNMTNFTEKLSFGKSDETKSCLLDIRTFAIFAFVAFGFFPFVRFALSDFLPLAIVVNILVAKFGFAAVMFCTLGIVYLIAKCMPNAR